MLRGLARKTKGKVKRKAAAQVTMEFIFCMMVVFLMIYGMIKVFHWSALDLAGQRVAHETMLVSNETDPFPMPYTVFSPAKDTILRQIDPFYYFPKEMNAILGQDL